MLVRRAPKLAPFVLLGIAVGLIGTLLATSFFPADPSVGFAVLAGYFSLYGVTAGLVLGILVWLVLDRRSKREEKSARARRDD
jgi:hypothetical protein